MNDEIDFDLTPDQWETLKALRVPTSQAFCAESIRARRSRRAWPRGGERQHAGHHAEGTQGPDQGLVQIMGRRGLTFGHSRLRPLPNSILVAADAVPAGVGENLTRSRPTLSFGPPDGSPSVRARQWRAPRKMRNAVARSSFHFADAASSDIPPKPSEPFPPSLEPKPRPQDPDSALRRGLVADVG